MLSIFVSRFFSMISPTVFCCGGCCCCRDHRSHLGLRLRHSHVLMSSSSATNKMVDLFFFAGILRIALNMILFLFSRLFLLILLFFWGKGSNLHTHTHALTHKGASLLDHHQKKKTGVFSSLLVCMRLPPPAHPEQRPPPPVAVLAAFCKSRKIANQSKQPAKSTITREINLPLSVRTVEVGSSKTNKRLISRPANTLATLVNNFFVLVAGTHTHTPTHRADIKKTTESTLHLPFL